MENIIINPDDQNPNSKETLVCNVCGNYINQQNIFKFTLGTTISNVFFPGKQTFLYHLECIKSS